MSPVSRAGALVLIALSAAGCQSLGGALGGGGGVMPASDIGPPPSLRGSLPNRDTRSAAVDPDGQPLQTTPTRQLALPKNVRGEVRSADAGPRKISRDEIEGDTTSRSSGGGMAPALTPGGGVGLGGKF